MEGGATPPEEVHVIRVDATAFVFREDRQSRLVVRQPRIQNENPGVTLGDAVSLRIPNALQAMHAVDEVVPVARVVQLVGRVTALTEDELHVLPAEAHRATADMFPLSRVAPSRSRGTGGRALHGAGVKAIPTWYGGLKFRSRLEARHARLFDVSGTRYLYEPVTVHLPGLGTATETYTVDFELRDMRVLHGHKWRRGQTVFVEVKPHLPSATDLRKCTALSAAAPEAWVLVIHGAFHKGPGVVKEDASRSYAHEGGVRGVLFRAGKRLAGDAAYGAVPSTMLDPAGGTGGAAGEAGGAGGAGGAEGGRAIVDDTSRATGGRLLPARYMLCVACAGDAMRVAAVSDTPEARAMLKEVALYKGF